MIAVHRFSASHKRPREPWFELVETNDIWQELGPVGDGESQSLRVVNPMDQMLGIAKPGPAKAAEGGHCRAAHEKLAFDLSCLLGLHVPPVLLWREGLGAPYVVGRAISCWSFPQAMKWSEAVTKGLLSTDLRLTASADISCMRVFHTWIGDTDRKTEHIIVDLDSPNSGLRTSFIDHGNSMSLAWRAPDSPIAVIQNYAPEVPEDRDAMRYTAEAIAALVDQDIERLVNRVPVQYLPQANREVILSNLLSRRAKLLGIFSS